MTVSAYLFVRELQGTLTSDHIHMGLTPVTRQLMH